MYIKNQLRKRFIISAITVIIMVITILCSSYALFMDIKTDVNDQVLTVGDLQITFLGGSSINVNDIDPMSDEEAEELTNNEYTFTIQNGGSVPYSYTIYVQDNPAYSEVTLLNHAYIRVNFNNTGARTLSDLTGGEVFQGNLAAGQSKAFVLKVWVADPDLYDLPNEALGSEIHLNIVVDGRAGVS